MFDIALPVDAFQGMLSHSLPLLASAPPWAGEGSFLGKMVVLFVGAIFIGSSFAIGQALAGERGGVVLGFLLMVGSIALTATLGERQPALGIGFAVLYMIGGLIAAANSK